MRAFEGGEGGLRWGSWRNVQGRIELRAQHRRGRARVVVDRGSAVVVDRGRGATTAAAAAAVPSSCHIRCAYEPERGTKEPFGFHYRLTSTESSLDLHSAALGNDGHFHVHTVSSDEADGCWDEGRCAGTTRRAVLGTTHRAVLGTTRRAQAATRHRPHCRRERRAGEQRRVVKPALGLHGGVGWGIG